MGSPFVQGCSSRFLLGEVAYFRHFPRLDKKVYSLVIFLVDCWFVESEGRFQQGRLVMASSVKNGGSLIVGDIIVIDSLKAVIVDIDHLPGQKTCRLFLSSLKTGERFKKTFRIGDAVSVDGHDYSLVALPTSSSVVQCETQETIMSKTSSLFDEIASAGVETAGKSYYNKNETPVQRFIGSIKEQITYAKLEDPSKAGKRLWFYAEGGAFVTKLGYSPLSIGGHTMFKAGASLDDVVAFYEKVIKAIEANEGDLVKQIDAKSEAVSKRLTGTKGKNK